MKKERIKAQVSDLVLNEGQIVWLPKNPRQWTQTAIDNLKKSLERDSDFQEDRPLLVLRYEDKWLVFGGNLRTTAAKALRWNIIDAICYTPECEEDKEIIKRRAILDNGSFGEWDLDALANEWDDLPLDDWGVNMSWDKPKESKSTDKDLSNDIESSFRVEIQCASEGEQEMIYSEMVGRGFECRILTL